LSADDASLRAIEDGFMVACRAGSIACGEQHIIV